MRLFQSFGDVAQSYSYGSKFKAVNAKGQNFTKSELDDRLAYLNKNIHVYMKALEEADKKKLGREEIEAKLKELNDRKARYEGQPPDN